ncbi:MAG: hypothetical protein C4K58_04690 [Flavobacteriaceae bacterium]|nr:MAG: hypothetical protein C4K58_04690 [Flavobacteriaceae bacterium]
MRASFFRSILIYFLFLGLIFFSSCSTTVNYFRYNMVDVYDIDEPLYQKRRVVFPTDSTSFRFEKADKEKSLDNKIKLGQEPEISFEEILATRGKTQSFLWIQNDTIVSEKYYDKADAAKPINVMSVSKSIVATCFGIAQTKGLMDPEEEVRKYLPELNPKIKDLKIKDLLNMQAGFRHHEYRGSLTPFGKVIGLYYGPDIYKYSDKKSIPAYSPGQKYHYQSMATVLLTRCIAAASGTSFEDFVYQELILPLDFEYSSLWATDMALHPKGFAGFSVTARDLAKIGRLYLQGGNWNGKQILSKEFVDQIFSVQPTNGGYYHYSFRTNMKFTPVLKEEIKENPMLVAQKAVQTGATLFLWNKDYYLAEPYPIKDVYAVGVLGNFLYMDPSTQTIIVRTGNQLSSGDVDWNQLFRALVRGESYIDNQSRGIAITIEEIDPTSLVDQQPKKRRKNN